MKFTNNFYSPIAWQRTDRAVKALQSTSHKPILAKQWNTSSHKSTSLQTRDNCCVYKTQLSFKTDKSGTLAQTFRQLKWKYSHACLQNSRPHLSASRLDRMAVKIKGRVSEDWVRPTSTPACFTTEFMLKGWSWAVDTFLWEYQSMQIKAVIRKCDPLKDEHRESHLIFRTHIFRVVLRLSLRPQVSCNAALSWGRDF